MTENVPELMPPLEMTTPEPVWQAEVPMLPVVWAPLGPKAKQLNEPSAAPAESVVDAPPGHEADQINAVVPLLEPQLVGTPG